MHYKLFQQQQLLFASENYRSLVEAVDLEMHIGDLQTLSMYFTPFTGDILRSINNRISNKKGSIQQETV